MYNTILLAVDGSENSLRAVKEAVKVAALVKGAEVTLLYVIDHKDDENDELHDTASVEFELARQGKIQPARDALEKEEIFYQVEMIYGIPAQTIIEFANERNFDMVVIGKRGLNKMQKLIMGSVSQKVANETDCPVLVVK